MRKQEKETREEGGKGARKHFGETTINQKTKQKKRQPTYCI